MREEISKAGGLEKLHTGVARDESLIAALREIADKHFNGPAFEGLPASVTSEDLDERMEFENFQIHKGAKAIEREIAPRRRLLQKAALPNDKGLGSLIALAEKARPQGAKSIDRSRLYIKRWVEFLGGDKEPSAITQTDAGQWRDHLNASGLSGVNQAQHLAKVKALFAIAVDEGVLSTNPFAGIKPRFKKDEKRHSNKKRAFTDEELLSLFDACRRSGEPVYTIVLCLALTGARSSEICGLRVCDVRQVDGFLCLDINDEVRHLKNDASQRPLPVPNSLRAGLMALAQNREGQEPLFEGLPVRKQGPAHQIQIVVSKLIRKHVSSDRRLTLHCLRHTWRQRSEALQINSAVRRAVLGHSLGHDAHDTAYGSRPPVSKIAEAVELVAHSYDHDLTGSKSGANCELFVEA